MTIATRTSQRIPRPVPRIVWPRAMLWISTSGSATYVLRCVLYQLTKPSRCLHHTLVATTRANSSKASMPSTT